MTAAGDRSGPRRSSSLPVGAAARQVLVPRDQPAAVMSMAASSEPSDVVETSGALVPARRTAGESTFKPRLEPARPDRGQLV